MDNVGMTSDEHMSPVPPHESGSAQQLKEDVTCFLDNAKRTISHEQQFNPLTGHSTYAEAPKGVHIHHVDEQDLVGHRGSQYTHTHHLLSVHESKPKSHRHDHHGKHKKNKGKSPSHKSPTKKDTGGQGHPVDVQDGEENASEVINMDDLGKDVLPPVEENERETDAQATGDHADHTDISVDIPAMSLAPPILMDSPDGASPPDGGSPPSDSSPPNTRTPSDTIFPQSTKPQNPVAFFLGDSSSDLAINSMPDGLPVIPGSDKTRRNVKFHVDDDMKTLDVPSDATRAKTSRRKSDGFGECDLNKRRRLGSEVHIRDHVLPTDEDEARMLAGTYLNDMSSHRLADRKGVRRRIISPRSAAHMANIKARNTTPTYDHSPHEIFIEMDEISASTNVWQEKSRWIQYEENLQEGSRRWGPPHVPLFSFHSFLQLRSLIETGSVLLDVEAADVLSIIDHICDHLIVSDQLKPEDKGLLIRALLMKHSHVGQDNFLRRNLTNLNLFNVDSGSLDRSSQRGSFISSLKSPFSTRRNDHSTPAHPVEQKTLIQDMKFTVNNDSTKETGDHTTIVVDKPSGESSTDEPGVVFSQSTTPVMNGASRNNSHTSLNKSPLSANDQRTRKESHLMRRLPAQSEAMSVLVGSQEFLKGNQTLLAFVRLAEGRYLEGFLEVPLPVRFIFLFLGPEDGVFDYQEVGSSMSSLMSNGMFHDAAYRADCKQDLLDSMNLFLDDSVVLPPGEWDNRTLKPVMDMTRKNARRKTKAKLDAVDGGDKPPPFDPLKRTGRLFGGLLNDIKRRYPLYRSDIRDAFNIQCVSAFFFIFFACLAPAITFGGLLGEKTSGFLGVSELLVSTSLCGIIFSLFSCQPLLIVGHSGPILVFEQSLYQFCDVLSVDYLPTRFWVGVWLLLIAVTVVMLEGSFLVGYITRFTEEIFASLISLIFIFEVFNKLASIFREHPLLAKYTPVSNGTDFASNVTDFTSNATEFTSDVTFSTLDVSPQEPNTALLSVILTFGTFFIAHFLKNFRNSHFLGRNVRRALGDFGIPIAIIVMVTADVLIKETFTQKLNVPDGFVPTAADKRSWLTSPVPSTLPLWIIPAACAPALLLFILIFMETQITSIIVNKSERCLQKGSGYHNDLLLMGVFAVICGTFGLPFMVVATVRSVAHVSALTRFSRSEAPGVKPKLEGVYEQRMTNLAVHVMIGVSVLMSPILKQVPLAVLFGVFLYMGIASMNGIQFFERCELMLMPVKHHPDVGYVRKVRTSKMHLYTVLQLVCLALLWAIKSSPAALAFPFLLILMVPFRLKILKYMFTENELNQLDCDETSTSKADEEYDKDDEPDFYTQAHMPI